MQNLGVNIWSRVRGTVFEAGGLGGQLRGSDLLGLQFTWGKEGTVWTGGQDRGQ